MKRKLISELTKPSRDMITHLDYLIARNKREIKKLDRIMDCVMPLVIIMNILMWIWTRGWFSMLAIGFLTGLWLSNIMNRSLRWK